MTITNQELDNWLPVKLKGLSCEWLYTGEHKYSEPFFGDTMLVCRQIAENRYPCKQISALEQMVEWAQLADATYPAAFIFHVSRCGSTLLSQLLTLNKDDSVLSEVPFFDQLLRLPLKNDTVDPTDVAEYLSAAIKLYSRKTKRNLFIKTDSWHLHFYEQLRRMFPGVPFILLYRSPGEVIASQQKRRGMQSVPGLIEREISGLSEQQVSETNLDTYMSSVLCGYFRKMIHIVKSDSLVIAADYKNGMISLARKIYNITGTQMTDEMEARMSTRMNFHGKHPEQVFLEDRKAIINQPFMAGLTALYDELNLLAGNTN